MIYPWLTLLWFCGVIGGVTVLVPDPYRAVYTIMFSGIGAVIAVVEIGFEFVSRAPKEKK